jgi:orotidine-5'-phosphate decarboxylase
MAEVVLALDLPDPGAAMALIRQLSGVRWAKVGSVLHTAAGPAIAELLHARQIRIFLDLKWHDIPNTVAGAVRAARSAGVGMVTVHALGGREMIQAAVEAAAGEIAVVAVTVLTSHDEAGFGLVVGRAAPRLGLEVERLADLAIAAGADGLVCSPRELRDLRARVGPEPLLVSPGIRRAGDSRGDQARIGTPEAAARAGATHLVVGRPVATAADPALAWQEFLAAAAP